MMAEEQVRETAQPGVRRLRRRVLLLEQDTARVSGLEPELRAAGCQVETACGSFEYLPRLAVAASKADVVLVPWAPQPAEDCGLLEELRKLRSTPGHPLVASIGGQADAEAVDAILPAPFAMGAFRRLVESWELASTFKAAAPALDGDAVTDLAQLDGGALLHELTQVCLETTPHYVEQARRAGEAGKLRELREAAHILKGSSGVFGARRLAGLCDALEEMARSGSLAGVTFLLDRLEAESRTFGDELRMLVETPPPAPSADEIDLSGMAATFQGKRILAQGLPARLAERLGALLFAMDAQFRALPEPGGAVEWKLAADLLIVAGDQSEASWEYCRMLRKQLPRAGMVLLLEDPSLESMDRTEELGAEVISSRPELRDLLLRSYQQLQICRRPRAASIPAAALPSTPATQPAMDLGSLAQNVARQGPLRALVAEDESLTARFLVSVLEANGFQADHAENGTRAVSMLSVRTYDAVMLDLNMPELDGYGVLSKLRQMPQYAGTPVLVLSARNQERDILRAFSLGASDYVTKPFSPPEVVFRLKRMVENN